MTESQGVTGETSPEDWRETLVDRVRVAMAMIDGPVLESRMWRKPSNPEGVAVWSCGGILFTAEPYREKVKFTFARGADLSDPSGLLNSGTGKTRRAIDVGKNDMLNIKAFTELAIEAIRVNRAKV